MSNSEPAEQANDLRDQPIFDRLKLYFAMLTVLGGFVLAVGNDGAVIPVIAIFFAIVGYVFVDVLKLFSLPPTAAYIAMALAAAFCIIDFADGDAAGPRKLLAVSHLLVIVQAILMMQRKSRRIFEQLAIFCLLELIVAAVFNHALNFGLLLIPIGIISALALGLLASASTVRGLEPDDESDHSTDGAQRGLTAIQTSSGESTRFVAEHANQYARVTALMLAPAVTLVALVFFYTLPRTSDAARSSSRGSALVGFSDHVHLEQMGQMLLDPEIALQVDLSDRVTGRNYRTYGGIYLRGRTLERYEARTIGDRSTAIWKAIPIDPKTEYLALPGEFLPSRVTDTNFYDAVNVSISCESMRSGSLFAIAPYHRRNQSPDIVHLADRWTIRRRGSNDWVRPPIEYSFGTNAFRSGIQSEFIAQRGTAVSATEQDDSPRTRQVNTLDQKFMRYRELLLEYDPAAMPTITEIAQSYALDQTGQRRTDIEIANAIEQHFKTPGRYRYSLNLRSKTTPGLDPIEQFVSVDQQGHCQYFASALAMMLRSQRIPARVVVGYHTDEYDEWTGQWIARQLHAHAWVEALIDGDQINRFSSVYGQPPSDQYWMRLDPTPAANELAQDPGTIRQSIDLAQNLWDDYIVDMDAERQQNSVMVGGLQPSGQWYDDAVDWLSGQMRRIQAGDFGGGSLASREIFSWPAAIGGIMIIGLILLLMQIRLPKQIGQQRAKEVDRLRRLPTVRFYATALDELARAGIQRRDSQTPKEFAISAASEMSCIDGPSIEGPMERLTEKFYRHRFGGVPPFDYDDQVADIEADLASVRSSVDSIMHVRSQIKHKSDKELLE